MDISSCEECADSRDTYTHVRQVNMSPRTVTLHSLYVWTTGLVTESTCVHPQASGLAHGYLLARRDRPLTAMDS